MFTWIVVIFIIVVAVGAVLYQRVRARSKSRAAELHPPAGDGQRSPSDVVSGDGGSEVGSASRWLRSLVKAEGDERAKRKGERY